MIQKLRNSNFYKYFWIFMSMYLFNCSVDTPDQYLDHIPEKLLSNEQESMIELILETGFGIDNAIPESEDADADHQSSIKKQVVFDLYGFSIVETRLNTIFSPTKLNRVFFFPLNFDLPFIPITSPPPEY